MGMNFNSQICTTKFQSVRLLELGLKKETADMVYFFSQSLAQDWTIVPLAENETARNIEGVEIPAWSLHRLIILIGNIACDWIFRNGDCYTNAINCIEWLIKEGYFNKEYLVDQGALRNESRGLD